MFNKIASKKNNYLNHYCCKTNPALVDKFFITISDEDEISKNIIQEIGKLGHPDKEVYLSSIKNLRNLLVDSKNFYQAIKFGIIEKLSEVLENDVSTESEVYAMLKLIARRFYGAEQLAKYLGIIHHICDHISAKSERLEDSLELLYEMSNHPTVVRQLNEDSREIHPILQKASHNANIDTPILYHLIINLVEGNDEFKTEEYFRALFKKIIKSQENLPEKLKCLGVLVNSEAGQKFADNNFLVDLLMCILNNSKLDEPSHANAIFCLKNCLISHFGMIRYRRHWETVTPILIKKAATRDNILMQIYAFETLRLISYDPDIKVHFQTSSDKIKSIFCLSTEALQLKKDLLK